MKKLILLISGLVLSATVSTTSAQQLPNNDFQGGWADCSPWTSNGTSKVGKTPTSWTISHVAGYKAGISWMGKTQVGEETTAGHDSNSAVKIYNSANSMKPDQIVPGYVTLGTSWSTANTSGENADGGTFGGISFSYKPDAVSFWYTRSHGTENASEQATVVAYIWKGTYTQANVPGNIGGPLSLKKVTMTDRDRNILDMSTAQGGDVSKTGAARLAKIDYALQGDASEWTNKVIDFTYEAGAASETPEKFNIIFAAGNYWSTSPGKDNTLCVDDVKLVYYSRLKRVLLGGYLVPLKDGVYDYVAYVGNPTSCNATVLGEAAFKTVTSSIDTANNIYSITVTNNNDGETATDIDGFKSHTYNFKYMSQKTGHIGVMNLPEGTFKFGPKEIPVDYIQEADGTYALSFGDPDGDFVIDNDGFILGRTVIKGVTMTEDSEGCYVFTKDGVTDTGDYAVSLVNDGATKCIYDPADGRWIFNFDVNVNGKVTRVTVTSDTTLSGVNGMNEMNERVVARHGAIEVSGFDGVAEVYTVDGRLVAKTTVAGSAQIAASNGIYLVRTPNTVKKVVVR